MQFHHANYAIISIEGAIHHNVKHSQPLIVTKQVFSP